MCLHLWSVDYEKLISNIFVYTITDVGCKQQNIIKEQLHNTKNVEIVQINEHS